MTAVIGPAARRMVSTRSSQSCGGLESVSSRAMISPAAASKPAAAVAGMPCRLTDMRLTPAALQMSAVLSVLALSTTMISSAGLVCWDRSMRHVFSMTAVVAAGNHN